MTPKGVRGFESHPFRQFSKFGFWAIVASPSLRSGSAFAMILYGFLKSKNNFCPLKVKLGKDNQHLATGWLDCALRLVVFGSNFHKESRDKLVDAIATEIERSIPLNPIRLTPEGDYLSEYPPRIQHLGGLEYFVEHTRDGDDLDHCVGVHKYCGCFMDRRGATETHDAIVCRGCHLRVLFPKTVKTYGELRQALSHK